MQLVAGGEYAVSQVEEAKKFQVLIQRKCGCGFCWRRIKTLTIISSKFLFQWSRSADKLC